MRSAEADVREKTRERGRFARRVEVTRTSADVERLTRAFGGVLRSGPRPLSCNYCSGMAAPITARLIV